MLTLNWPKIDLPVESLWYQTVLKLQAEIVNASFEFFKQKRIAPALLPVTTGSISSPMGKGSDSLPVQINLFEKNTYLADSMQFYLEYLVRFHRQGAWYIMPSFRGEEPDERHLNQFFHAEAEIPGTLEDVIRLVEKYLIYLTRSLLNEVSSDIEIITKCNLHLERVGSLDSFLKLSYSEVKKYYSKYPQFFTTMENGCETLSREGERGLLAEFKQPVWVTHFPCDSVPFYQARDEENNALCADLLMGIGETVGCGQRHVTEAETLESMHMHEVVPDEYEWYLAMKADHPLQTSGFGLGLERFLAWILKESDIRKIPLFNRLKGENVFP